MLLWLGEKKKWFFAAIRRKREFRNTPMGPFTSGLCCQEQTLRGCPKDVPGALLCPGTWWHSWGRSLGNHISILTCLYWSPFPPCGFSQLQPFWPLGFSTQAGQFSQPQKGKRVLWSSLDATEFVQVQFICLFFSFNNLKVLQVVWKWLLHHFITVDLVFATEK